MHGTAPGAANVSHREPGLARVGHVQVRARVVSPAAKKVIDISMYLYVCVMSQNVTYMAFFSNEPPSTNQIRSSVHPSEIRPRPIQTPPPIFRHGSRASAVQDARDRIATAPRGVEGSLDAKGRTRRLVESMPVAAQGKDKPRVGRASVGGTSSSRASFRGARRVDRVAPARRDRGERDRTMGGDVGYARVDRPVLIRRRTSSSSIGCVPVGAACQPRQLII